MHSELSEALEAHRDGDPNFWYAINGKPVARVQPGSL